MSRGHSDQGAESAAPSAPPARWDSPALSRDASSLGSWRAIIWRDAPSWLVSAVLHLSALILLGLVYFRGELAEITQITGAWLVADAGPGDDQPAAEPR